MSTIDPSQEPRLAAGLRVALVCSSLELGGAERQALLLANHLRDHCASAVTVFGMGRPGRLCDLMDQQRVAWQVLPRLESRFALRTWLRIRVAGAMLARARPDVLLPFAMPANLLCAIAGSQVRARCSVWNQRGAGLFRAPRWLERQALSRCTGFIANSRAGVDFLAANGVERTRIAMIINGVALAQPQADRAAWRQRLGLSAECLVVCMLANLSRTKDHATMLQAWRRVAAAMAARGQDARLLLCGRHDDGYPLVAKMVSDPALAHSVQVVGMVDDVSGLLQSIDIGVLCSPSEAGPNAVLEYMASGRAVIASDIPGIRLVLGDADAACLVPPGDPEALATSLLRVLADPALRARLGADNRQRALTQFSAQRMLSATTAYLARLLASARPGGAG